MSYLRFCPTFSIVVLPKKGRKISTIRCAFSVSRETATYQAVPFSTAKLIPTNLAFMASMEVVSVSKATRGYVNSFRHNSSASSSVSTRWYWWGWSASELRFSWKSNVSSPFDSEAANAGWEMGWEKRSGSAVDAADAPDELFAVEAEVSPLRRRMRVRNSNSS